MKGYEELSRGNKASRIAEILSSVDPEYIEPSLILPTEPEYHIREYVCGNLVNGPVKLPPASTILPMLEEDLPDEDDLDPREGGHVLARERMEGDVTIIPFSCLTGRDEELIDNYVSGVYRDHPSQGKHDMGEHPQERYWDLTTELNTM